MRREPFDLQHEQHVITDQIPNVASALGDFDQSMKLIVAGARFNLKFYFNFLDMPFFIGPRTYRHSAKLDFAHARSHSKRHQQASTERTEERRNRIRRRLIVT